MVSCSENAAGFGGSQIWLKPGEEMTVEDLLKASAIASANDATVCLAEYVAGSETAFVAMMNERAHQLGMSDTQFFCAAGLDTEGHQSSAADIAIMSRALLEHPMILNYTTVWMDSLRDGATQLVNTNRLVRFYQGATGLKTGTTSGAGCCLSASAERSGLGLIAVVMGAATSDDRFASARALLDWGFANYEFHQLEPPELVQPLPVSGGVASEIELFCAQPDGIVIEKGQLSALTQELVLPESVTAPILSGDAVGSVVVCVHGERVAEYPVFAANTVEKMTLPRAFVILGKKLFSMN